MTIKYPARSHAQNVIEELAKLVPKTEHDKMHGIFLQGSPTLYRDDTDRELLFHQEANFNYLTGALHPSCSVAIFFSFSDPSAVSHNLFIPPEDPAETMWSVPPPSLAEAEATYDSDKIQYISALPSFLEAAAKCAKSTAQADLVLHTLPRTMEYPALPTTLDKVEGISQNTEYLFKALHIARLVKDDHEISLIKHANEVSSGAHEVVMRELGRFASRRQQNKVEGVGRHGKEGLLQWEIESEGDAEAVFVAACRRMGATTQAYLPIVASGSRASTLHYVCNDRLFPSTSIPRKAGDTSFTPPNFRRGCCGTLAPEHSHSSSPVNLHAEPFFPQVLLIDAGCEWQGYAADITRTIPVGNGGKFTKEAGEIYELVLRMQKECEALVKPGVHWDTLHLHAHKVLVDGLLKLGIFKGDPEQVLQSGVTSGLFPHGLGHSLGLDVHDSRQYLKSTHFALPDSTASTPAKLYAYLRIRQPLTEGMVLTIEPGCYFAPQLMDEHGIWTSEFVDTDALKRYVGVGGVRIEDVVVVRSAGVENLTTVGREKAWIESVCSGKE
ncbi:xaa-Pro dipeptidase [Kwoniella heveanensis CBS 569]|nr:xaa-Pro dipeptidase [Kwoniella heveanensis CBS 569]